MASPQPEGRASRRSWRSVSIPVLALFAFALGTGCAKSRPNARIAINCTPQSPTSFACTATSTGPDPGRACWDVIVTCGGSEHEAAKQCAKKLAAGQSEIVIVALSAFEPPIKPDNADCAGLHVDEISIE